MPTGNSIVRLCPNPSGQLRRELTLRRALTPNRPLPKSGPKCCAATKTRSAPTTTSSTSAVTPCSPPKWSAACGRGLALRSPCVPSLILQPLAASRRLLTRHVHWPSKQRQSASHERHGRRIVQVNSTAGPLLRCNDCIRTQIGGLDREGESLARRLERDALVLDLQGF